MESTEMETALSPRQALNGHRVLRIPGCAFKMGTWNVRSIYEDGKTYNTIQEMERMSLDILGVSEMRWKGKGETGWEKHKIYFSGNYDTHHWNGVGFIVTKEMAKHVINFTPLTDRVALLKLNGHPFNLNIIQVYAPTAESSDDAIKSFYSDIMECLKLTKNHDINIIMGDMNAKVGQRPKNDVVGSFGLGSGNERGDRLVDFCLEHNYVITNTFFQLPPRRLYTWKSPMDKPGHIVRNQIDYIMVNKRFRNSFTSVKTYPGADVGSDHNPVVGVLRIKLEKVKK
ncbi:craniofacial development protein 2-like [Melitaea cinxia]|uniref:craniofacial development protein 2-like n=1 Tax=Melitaea cinxia TaxID=113334 RepID=UPI001E271D74|nr:craniofacial development protein 2-like [Melitaea cinxia]